MLSAKVVAVLLMMIFSLVDGVWISLSLSVGIGRCEAVVVAVVVIYD